MIEQHDNFIKQTYRNRCVIATTQGLQALTIPVERPSDARLDKTQLKDICISDHGNWRHLHWKALLSAYGESPFFEYYADDIHPFYEKKYKFLLDFNMEINAKMMELLDIEKSSLSLSNEYSSYEGDCDTVDFREVIRPKHPGEDKEWQPKKYYQVYQQKFGFQPNLSILDLLFNEGNEAVCYL